MSIDNNSLLVIQGDEITEYLLDDKESWNIGRKTPENNPDIELAASGVSRQHGQLNSMDGVWFYNNIKAKNGTAHNGKPVKEGIGGRIKPVILRDRDVLLFGSEDNTVCSKNVWAMFSKHPFNSDWRVEKTSGCEKLVFKCCNVETVVDHPVKGAVIGKGRDMAIYMGDITFITGNISIVK